MSPDNGPVSLCCLQFGGKALRPDGLFGVVIPSFILLAKELVNKLLGALWDVRERGTLRVGGTGRSVVTSQKRGREIGGRSGTKTWQFKIEEEDLLQTAADHWRGVRGTLIGVLEARHCYRKT